jgi:hypothetical protein
MKLKKIVVLPVVTILAITTAIVVLDSEQPSSLISPSMWKYAQEYCAKKGYDQIYRETDEDEFLVYAACAKKDELTGAYLSEDIDWTWYNLF